MLTEKRHPCPDCRDDSDFECIAISEVLPSTKKGACPGCRDMCIPEILRELGSMGRIPT